MHRCCVIIIVVALLLSWGVVTRRVVVGMSDVRACESCKATYHPMFIPHCQGKGIGSAGGGCLSPVGVQVVVVLMVGLVACVEHSWPVVVVVGGHRHWWRVVYHRCRPLLWGFGFVVLKMVIDVARPDGSLVCHVSHLVVALLDG